MHPLGIQRPLKTLQNSSCLRGRCFTSVETDPFVEYGGGYNVLLEKIEDLPDLLTSSDCLVVLFFSPPHFL